MPAIGRLWPGDDDDDDGDDDDDDDKSRCCTSPPQENKAADSFNPWDSAMAEPTKLA